MLCFCFRPVIRFIRRYHRAAVIFDGFVLQSSRDERFSGTSQHCRRRRGSLHHKCRMLSEPLSAAHCNRGHVCRAPLQNHSLLTEATLIAFNTGSIFETASATIGLVCSNINAMHIAQGRRFSTWCSTSRPNFRVSHCPVLGGG